MAPLAYCPTAILVAILGTILAAIHDSWIATRIDTKIVAWIDAWIGTWIDACVVTWIVTRKTTIPIAPRAAREVRLGVRCRHNRRPTPGAKMEERGSKNDKDCQRRNSRKRLHDKCFGI